ncbi:hypothetical protein PILCRDRAFT_820606 [Piloderma croceum F 1598]|uniref:Uncharacterized protein n=1 Tax=Piloderma croceum (strain F 1598) TaxID=765440 RepID=A0A0C3FTR0_PILCF|nr:hypothetical protein PILCRDRAFT_820606 [Piloderma croceum F 1598]
MQDGQENILGQWRVYAGWKQATAQAVRAQDAEEAKLKFQYSSWHTPSERPPRQGKGQLHLWNGQ